MKYKDKITLCKNMDNINKEKRIKIGDARFLRVVKTVLKKHETEIIQSCFDGFKKDIRDFYKDVNYVHPDQQMLINTFNSNKNNLPIFEIEDDDLEYNINFPQIPFNKFFIATKIIKEIKNELYGINGFFVINYNSTHLLIIYVWSGITTNGWKIAAMLISKCGIIKKFNKNRTKFHKHYTKNNLIEASIEREIEELAIKKFKDIMKKLIYKISKKEYGCYKIHTNGVYTTQEISRDVMGHKRHFWKDSGKFIIPTLSSKEILRRGYEIAKLAIRNGTLRVNVPFKIISSYHIGNKEEKEKNKIYSLISKRVWRCEEKVYRIVRELFPDKLIRRHDRRKLKGLELDMYLPELRLGIEYDGEQHYNREICEGIFKSDFDAQIRRDRKKDKLCRRGKIILIRIKYDESLTKTHIKKKLKQFL